MAEYLVFTLAASLGAMGDIAGHERRGSWTWPGRSAILGLLGAALGVRRDDREGQEALNALKMAVASYSEGVPLRDYHTVQTVPSAAAKSPNSRADAFRTAGLNVNTTITLRDYRAGVLYAVAIRDGDLERLKAALLQPVFTLYLGRKSCPLSLPPVPHIVRANSFQEVFADAALPNDPDNKQEWRLCRIAADTGIAADFGLNSKHSEVRTDVPLDREKWHFTARQVHYWYPDQKPVVGEEATA